MLKQSVSYLGKTAFAYLFPLGLLFFASLAAVYLRHRSAIRLEPGSLLLDLGLPILFAMLPGVVVLWGAWTIAGRFVRSLYGLESSGAGMQFLSTRLLGQLTEGPFVTVKEGKIRGSDRVRQIGGPCGLVLYNDSAVVLEKAGKITKVFRGSTTPPFLLPPPKLEPFEKIWDILDLRPQRWEFGVSAITRDGIPITYNADVGFQIGDTDDDIFKAATCKWIRDAWRTEPDRLMTWPKLVVIGATEGTLRAILARYTLDQLIDRECREEVRDELEKGLRSSAPGLGVKILRVALGDIQLKDQVVQQWMETWRAERTRELDKTVEEGRAQADRIKEQARNEVRTSMLLYTVRLFAEVAKRKEKIPKGFVLLSFVDMIKRTSSAHRWYMPDDVVRTLNMLEKRFRKVPLLYDPTEDQQHIVEHIDEKTDSA